MDNMIWSLNRKNHNSECLKYKSSSEYNLFDKSFEPYRANLMESCKNYYNAHRMSDFTIQDNILTDLRDFLIRTKCKLARYRNFVTVGIYDLATNPKVVNNSLYSRSTQW